LVKFALDNGQPIDSAINGVLPIHAACCSNANVAVVLYLIERGADVNARRLPRKLSNEKGVQAVGTTGSTPLHFAAANGCLSVVDILLRHGAIVDMTDKYGSSPLSVAAARNHPDVASLLRQYSAMQRGVQDFTPDSEVKDVFPERRGSLDTHRGAATTPRTSTSSSSSATGQQKESNTQSIPVPSSRSDRATRAPGQRRISLPSIVESPSSPVILAPPRQSCDFDRMPQSTEPLVMSTAFIRSTPSQPTRNIASAQTRSDDRPSKMLIRDQPDLNLETTKDQTRRSITRSHTTHVTESNVLPKPNGASTVKRRKSMESGAFLSPQSALSVHRRKSFDQLAIMDSSDSKSRRSSDASTASQGTSSSGTTRTSNTSVSTEDATDLAEELAVRKEQQQKQQQQQQQQQKQQQQQQQQQQHKQKQPQKQHQGSVSKSTGSGNASALPSHLTRSISQSALENIRLRRLPASLASDSNPRQSLDLQRLASNMDRSAEKARNFEARNDSDSDLPGLLFHRRSLQETSFNVEDVSTTSPQDSSAPRRSTSSISSGHSGSTGTVNVSSRLSRMWSSSNSGSRESLCLRDGSIPGSSSASNWNANEFGGACGEAAAQNLAHPDINRSKGSMLNRLSGIWSRR
ncbi:hypothetical protein BGZ79_003398, partial [Entomortierella chlamydospora]